LRCSPIKTKEAGQISARPLDRSGDTGAYGSQPPDAVFRSAAITSSVHGATAVHSGLLKCSAGRVRG
jgi:hypothetical protein